MFGMGLYGKSSLSDLSFFSSPLLFSLCTYSYKHFLVAHVVIRFCRSFSLLLIFGYTLAPRVTPRASRRARARARFDLGDDFRVKRAGIFFRRSRSTFQ